MYCGIEPDNVFSNDANDDDQYTDKFASDMDVVDSGSSDCSLLDDDNELTDQIVDNSPGVDNNNTA
jgi:hypothetical protein